MNVANRNSRVEPLDAAWVALGVDEVAAGAGAVEVGAAAAVGDGSSPWQPLKTMVLNNSTTTAK